MLLFLPFITCPIYSVQLLLTIPLIQSSVVPSQKKKQPQAKYSGVGQHHGQRQWLRVGRGWGFAVDAANHGWLPVTRVKAVLLSRRKRGNSREAALV